MKYGLMSYDHTINLGNEIQSIAARRFLPKIDYYIDHEKIHEFGDGENVKMIMNAWYLDCLDAWPPSENIDPLLISMHFNSKKETQKVILSDESREYLSKYGPVGCRDIYTQNFLEENGIDAYFSGCLTLTLDSGSKYNYKDEDNDYILISSDKSAKLIPFLKERTNKRIYVINQDFLPSFEKAFPGS
ncbi:MAG: polysaccharide pyruvyl transferase family protein, partial [Methanobrevibacter sp.]|nr:polysaccharide pyruvyl transferase family protein [Methanobrevibacter sp.]